MDYKITNFTIKPLFIIKACYFNKLYKKCYFHQYNKIIYIINSIFNKKILFNIKKK